jgi:hypothetical protein
MTMPKSKATQSSRRDERRELSRRSLIKWSLAAGAVLGLPRWKTFEVLERSGGKALAADASCHPTMRSVHLIAGTGGFAWFQLLWPHNAIAASGNNNFAFHAFGQTRPAAGTDRLLTLAPEAPWKDLPGRRQVSALMAGSNETHTRNPNTASTLMGSSVIAVASALQTTNPSVVPVIAVGGANVGTAPGAPRPAAVASGDDIIGLFNSAASRAGGLLEDASDAELYSAHYQALIGLNRAAGRSTQLKSYETAQKAASLLGTNLASVLTPTDADLARYGVNLGTRNTVRAIARTLMVTAKAFRLGLTSSVVLPAFNDDPHGAFNDMANLRNTVAQLGAVLDGFWEDLSSTPDDSCAGKSLADSLVITVHGDTPKTPLNRSGWPDGTPRNSNWIYVLGNGYLRTGWFGGIRADGSARTFNPATGEEVDAPSSTTANAATAAVAYAIARGDERRVQDFARGLDIKGITVPQQL